ncbi:phosphoglycolate phosphatase [Vandammella animalimorsus]|uniref:phosphoglycolate phosphatase n=1 Tax=Vandammella animalimorsus TaxID=2029117 RepID=A0A2A2T6S9_9BURK|nr:HAD-IA family hydrolase [Vandammella animalimorsus]PAT32968.1 phosphoglycolate phosphatase [Vandammella animalimorsus]PAX17380.1 phosphoglycolate phosphatase [Vandammella animalimorsus]PAX19436.1 phosphoglycolate phosphatase [Vandammella animalimorsus]
MPPLRHPDIRAVLFDLDGTLIDSAVELAQALNQMRARRGLPALPVQRYRPHVGSGARGLLPIGLGTGPAHTAFEALRNEFFDTYAGCLGAGTQPFEGVAPMLQRLQARGIRWGIVTNKIERFARPIVAQAPALAHCAALVAGDTTAHTKPHPEPLLEAARRLGIAPAHCIYVGDDPRDMQAGRSAGMGTIAALYGYIAPGEDPAQWAADHSIQAPMELLQKLGID